jgi:hypothetical protein
MKRYLPCAVLLFAVLIPLHARAQSEGRDASVSGNRFLEICSAIEKTDRKESLSDTEAGDVAFCVGFMIGLSDGVRLSAETLKQGNSSLSYLKESMEAVGVCAPAGMPVGQGIRITLKYIREHPERAHLPTAELVFLAELNAFPCAPPPSPKPKQ